MTGTVDRFEKLGSTPLSRAVAVSAVITAARSPPRLEPAISHHLRPSATAGNSRSAALMVEKTRHAVAVRAVRVAPHILDRLCDQSRGARFACRTPVQSPRIGQPASSLTPAGGISRRNAGAGFARSLRGIAARTDFTSVELVRGRAGTVTGSRAVVTAGWGRRDNSAQFRRGAAGSASAGYYAHGS